MIVNTARGSIVVEPELAAALASGKVRAYATDVFLSDPPDPNSPLLSAPNVLMTPHLGGSSRENLLRIGDSVVRAPREVAEDDRLAAAGERGGRRAVKRPPSALRARPEERLARGAPP